MKFNQICRIGAAGVLSLAACLGLTACSRDYTVGFLYVTSSRGTAASPNGVLNEYGIDYQTGSLIRLASSGQDTGGRNPVAIVITPNTKNAIVANRDDSNLVTFKIGTDGKLFANVTTTVAGSFPTAMTISGDSKFLYVTFTFKPGFTTASPGPGGVEIFPISYDGDGYATLGQPVANGTLNYFPVGYNPVGISVTSNVDINTRSVVNANTCVDPPAGYVLGTQPIPKPADATQTYCTSMVYVIGQDPNTAITANMLAFRRTLASGAMAPIGQTVIGTGTTSSTGYNSGILASAIIAAPLGNYVYITDRNGNQVIAYSIPATGVPNPILTGPFSVGGQPDAITIDPRGKFLYVANYNTSNVSAFAIAPESGSLSAVAGTSVNQTGPGPTCVTVENALGQYLYTSNFLDNTVTGLQLNTATGVLVQIRNTPFPASAGPSCAAAVRNGTVGSSNQIIQ